MKLLETAVITCKICQDIEIDSLPCLSWRGVWLVSKDQTPFAVIKSRGANEKGCLAWHFSNLFGLSRFIAPACPVVIQGKKMIVQPYISMVTNRPELSTEEYWVANLIALLLGYTDLHDANIGFTEEKNILYFDNEAILFCTDDYRSHFDPTTETFSFSVPFINFMVDWPQGNDNLDTTTLDRLRAHTSEWKQNWPYLLQYLHHPLTTYSLDDQTVEQLKRRLWKIDQFLTTPDKKSIHNLISYLFPNYSLETEEPRKIVASILDAPDVGNMQAYIFLSNWMNWWPGITGSQRQELLNWIQAFHHFQNRAEARQRSGI